MYMYLILINYIFSMLRPSRRSSMCRTFSSFVVCSIGMWIRQWPHFSLLKPPLISALQDHTARVAVRASVSEVLLYCTHGHAQASIHIHTSKQPEHYTRPATIHRCIAIFLCTIRLSIFGTRYRYLHINYKYYKYINKYKQMSAFRLVCTQ